MWEKVIVKLLSPQLYYRPLRTDEKGVREVGAVSKALMKALCVFPRPILYLFFLLIDMVMIWNVGILILDYCLSFFGWLDKGCGPFEFQCFFTLSSFFKHYFTNW